jgi:hypothetical protein
VGRVAGGGVRVWQCEGGFEGSRCVRAWVVGGRLYGPDGSRVVGLVCVFVSGKSSKHVLTEMCMLLLRVCVSV